MKPLATFDSLYGVAGFVERVLVALEQAQVGVHPRALHALERLGHERGVDPLRGRRLPHHQPERHHAVGHREGVGVAEVDLVLARGVLVEGVLDRDAHRLQRLDRALAERAGHVGRREVEVRAGVERPGPAVVAGDEVEELHLRGDVEREATGPGPLEVAPQDTPGVTLEWSTVEVEDVAEDPGFGRVGIGPREQLEAVGVRSGEDVALLHPREAVDRRTIERHALLEGVLQLDRADREALQLAQNVGEPQPHEAYSALLDRAQDVVALSLHGHQSRAVVSGRASAASVFIRR